MQNANGDIIGNPVKASRPPTPRKKAGQAISVKTEELLIETTQKPWGLDVFLELDAGTGARRGELLGLQWSDLHGDVLEIKRSLSQVGQRVFLKDTKTVTSTRTITVPPSTLKALRSHRRSQEKFRQHFGEAYQGDFIFCNPDGSPLKPDTVSSAVSLLCRKLGLPKGVSLHTLRHSHGSHLGAAGVPIADISKRLGHANPGVTARIYSHAMDATDAGAAKAWETYRKKKSRSD